MFMLSTIVGVILSQKPKPSPKKGKILTKANITKVFLPSLALTLIILAPVAFEVFKIRHQQIDNVIDNPNLPDEINPFPNLIELDTDPYPPPEDDPDSNAPLVNFDNFTGISDPERILFHISPADEFFYWRYEAYDTYTMETWEKELTTVEYTGYTSLPSNADGQFTVTADLLYSGSGFSSYFPAPYNYIYGEEFSNAYTFSPIEDWVFSETSLNEDIYGATSIDATFENQIGNTTLSYPVAYTLQNNTYIKDTSAGFSALNSLISSNPELNTRYLQLPVDYSSSAPYTNQIASNLFNSTDTIYNQVFRNMVWLTTNNNYDYDMLLGHSSESPAEGEDYVEWFLNRRNGTASHFAASLAIISRLQNIPSRLVLGFSYGDQVGSEFIIRAKHIHSWVEVFIPIDGSTGYWVAFDPSPLIPGLRDQYGVNTIGFQAVFHCSNEFFLDSQHMHRQITAPYFIPNLLSSAWRTNPYNPSEIYGPYLNRTEVFTISAYLGSGYDDDFLVFLLTGVSGSLIPIEGELITFIDSSTGTILGSNYTNSTGYATLNYSYPSDAITGLHKIEADWIGIRVSTHDLRYIPDNSVETGVILTSTVNISSIDLMNNLISVDLDLHTDMHCSGFFYSETVYIETLANQEPILNKFLSKIISFFRSN